MVQIKNIYGEVLWEDETRKDLCGANLSGANLRQANLRQANLSGANLHGADLSGANLRGANLSEANLSWSHLFGADLFGADLSGADLFGADLSGANLSGADLSGAHLSRANLSRANLSEASLCEAKLPDFQIPQTGTLHVWKALCNRTLAKLQVYASSPRTASLIGRKCRAKKVKVLDLIQPSTMGDKRVQEGFSIYDPKFVYTRGSTIIEHRYNPDVRIECAPGIHFFLTREEAEKWFIT